MNDYDYIKDSSHVYSNILAVYCGPQFSDRRKNLHLFDFGVIEV